MTNRFRSIAVAAAVLALPALASAQDQIVKVGYTDVGGVIGFGAVGSGLSFGGRFERAIKELPDLGGGTLGIAVSVDYHSYGQDYIGYSWSYKFIPIGVTANYHFNLENKKIVPFLGLGLGYTAVTCSFEGLGVSGNDLCGYDSGIRFIGRAGARYFFKENMALYGDAGTAGEGGSALNVGLTFKLR